MAERIWHDVSLRMPFAYMTSLIYGSDVFLANRFLDELMNFTAEYNDGSTGSTLNNRANLIPKLYVFGVGAT
ncbi:MAG: hypothetical protein ACFFH0_10430 [Promethearchaeota archaeon]